jgi:acetyl-CoA carboxylase biotin carboxylase subunit
MGDKLVARQTAKALGIPVIPGSDLVHDFKEGLSVTEKMGFPVLLKAAAGGGGKGMKGVERPEDFKRVFEEAAAEARVAFGDDRIYIEHFILNARHIEVQILADHYGNAVHLFERDCSLQRRYQKMIEEAPSPALDADLREQICSAALRIVEHIGYLNAGTVEFILDQDQGKFYFLEMNTRIQVEHPVTEMITGIDLVREQIRIAGGEPISLSQDDIGFTGHAIECRINAELPDDNFRPSPGRISLWQAPEGDHIRVDSHCFSGYFVPPFYDSLLAKLVVKSGNRMLAIQDTKGALKDFIVQGVDTTIPFYRSIMEHPDYIKGEVHTRWVEDVMLKGES